MRCPACRTEETKVIDSRATEGGSVIRRRRMCLACNRRFTTKERTEEELRLTVVKFDGRRVPYQRDKIRRGLELACVKLDISDPQIEETVDHIEEDLFRNHEREVSSDQIGAYVGIHLRRLNPVAYVRFMSVHKKYDSVESFVDEIQDVRVRVIAESPAQQTLFQE